MHAIDGLRIDDLEAERLRRDELVQRRVVAKAPAERSDVAFPLPDGVARRDEEGKDGQEGTAVHPSCANAASPPSSASAACRLFERARGRRSVW